MRIGFGYDIHRLIPGRKLVLGGLTIPYPLGEDGHSDGDVLIHAIIDALLGAAALGDIGEFFPPTDPRFKDIKSTALLKETMKMLQEKGISLINIDSCIMLEKPNLGSYKKLIRESLASVLTINPDNVSIKAKTKEGQ